MFELTSEQKTVRNMASELARDANLLQIGGGTDEIQIVTIARSLLRDGVPES